MLRSQPNGIVQRELDLKVAPGAYVAPHHAPVSDVNYRVEKHLQIAGWRDQGAFEQAEERYNEVQAARSGDKEKLREFQEKSKARALRVRKEMQMAKLQWKRELDAKQEFYQKRKEYAKRVEALNTSHFRRVKEQRDADAASSSGSESDSDGSASSDRSPRFTAAASPPGSPSRHFTDELRRDDTNNSGTAVQVEKGSNAKVQVWRHAPPAGRRMPVPGGAPNHIGPDTDATQLAETAAQDVACAVGAPLSCDTASSLDEPVAPPRHVTQHVPLWQRQQALYKGALQPGVSAGDAEVGVDALARSLERCVSAGGDVASQSRAQAAADAPAAPQDSMAAHEGSCELTQPHDGEASLSHMQRHGGACAAQPPFEAAGGTQAQAEPVLQPTCPSVQASREQSPAQHVVLAAQRTANERARARARTDLLRRHATSALVPPPSPPLQSGLEQLLQDSVSNSRAQSASPATDGPGAQPDRSAASRPQTAGLERVAGGGGGLMASHARTSGHWAANSQPAMSEITNTASGSFAQQRNGVPTVHASRGTASAPVPVAPTKRAAPHKLPPAIHARLRDKVAQMGVELPSLCSCHNLPVLDAQYPQQCASNCPYHNNEAAYYDMLHSLLHAYNITV